MKFLKFLIALGLLPFLVAEVWTLLDFARAAIPDSTPRLIPLLSFALGLSSWLVIFFLMPRPMWFYVLGHELTHAWAAMLAGGKVVQFRVTSAGGYIATNRKNWWIALSPYFVPIYALIWGALWITIDFYYPLRVWQPIFYYGMGLFWMFHITFTWTMLHPRQTDLSDEGYFFSGVIILLMNLLVVLGLLLPLAHDLSWAQVERLATHHTVTCYQITGQTIAAATEAVWQKWRELNYGSSS